MTLKDLQSIFDTFKDAPEKALERTQICVCINGKPGETNVTKPVSNVQLIAEGSMAPKLIFNCYE